MKTCVFDVDGTLTPSREKIDEKFKIWFKNFCKYNKVYLVTGSDYPKTKEQLGDDVLDCIVSSYCCSGSDVWSKGKRIKTSNWEIPESLVSNLNLWLKDSKFKLKTGNHIEKRPGTVNFSIVGRKSSFAERQEYIKWDVATNERVKIAQKINTLYPNIQATVGGETGIDIYPRGKDKSQILSDFDKNDFIFFFGDKMDVDGNDFPLADVILKSHRGEVYHVKDWKHTFEILKGFEE